MDNTSYKYERGAVIIVPHFDDEVFQFGAYLTEYPHHIDIVFTHPTDTVSDELYMKQYNMMKSCINTLNDYRSRRNFEYPEIDFKVIPTAGPKGISSDNYLSAVSLIESIVRQYKEIDCYGFSIKSSHQSHTESNQIASHVMRSPYVEKMKLILNAPYPQTYYSPCEWTDGDRNYNVYYPITEDSANLLHYLIGEVYGEKNPPTGILGADPFLDALKFFGRASNKSQWAQPFICRRLVFC